MSIEIIATPMAGLYRLNRLVFEDARGFFYRLMCTETFSKMGQNFNVSQANVSHSSSRGTLRGLHLQRPPNSEDKLVTCISGSVWDVAVDVRPESKTFGKWYGQMLTAENCESLFVPKGFAHGFLSLEDNSTVVYMTSSAYVPESELTLAWDDRNVDINWPGTPQKLSSKDSQGLSLSEVKAQLNQTEKN